MRNFIVCFEGQCVGYTDLEHIDTGMGIAHGRFYPERSYQLIRAQVVRAAEDRHNGSAHTTPPRLDLTSPTGEIVSTKFVVIDDFDAVDIDPEITAAIQNREQYVRLIGGLTSR